MFPFSPRPYHGTDLSRLTAFLGRCNAVPGVVQSLHPGDFLHRLTNTMRGADPAPFFHSIDGADGEPVAVIELSKHGGFEAVVHPDLSGGEFERDVLRWCVAEQVALLDRMGATADTLTMDVLDTASTRGALLAEMGFTPAPQPEMALTMRDLSSDWPLTVLPDGFTIRSASGVEEADAIGAVHASAFKSNWPPGRYRVVMETPGFTIDHEMLVVAPSGELAAFLIYWLDPMSKSGLFEPVGTAQQYQQRGLAKALMTHTFGLMRAAGMTRAIVNHEIDNPASSRAYASIGFVRQATYTPYTRARR